MHLVQRRAIAFLLFAAACVPPAPRPAYMEPPRPKERVERIDTLQDFLGPMRAELDTGKAQEAWLGYEAKCSGLLAAAGAVVDDPGNAELIRLLASADAIVEVVGRFEQDAPKELDGVVEKMVQAMGGAPQISVAFAVSLGDAPVFRGAWEGRPLVLLNARHPDVADPAQRRATIARELFRALHRERVPGSPSLGPLADRIWREGAVSFASRQLAPDATESQLLGVPEDKLVAARKRERALAQELLATLDSGSELEAERFFDPSLKDPIIPRGGGPLIADRVYQRVAQELTSMTKPLWLPPSEFLAAARKQLALMAQGR